MSSDERQLHDLKLFGLCAAAVEDGIKLVTEAERSGKYINRKFSWVTMTTFENGLPHFNDAGLFGNSPKDYGSALGITEKAVARVDSVPSWIAAREYLLGLARFRDYFAEDLAMSKSFGIDWEAFHTTYFIREMVDDYLAAYGKSSFDTAKFLPLYSLREQEIFADNLPIEIVIPILFLTFSFDSLPITDSIHIRKMSNQFQIARGIRLKGDHTVHPIVAGAATHAFVFTQYTAPNQSNRKRHWSSTEEWYYPTDKIDLLFAAIRITLDVQTGYAQLLTSQSAWEQACFEQIPPPLTGATLRQYPRSFEKGGWLATSKTLTEADLAGAQMIARILIEDHEQDAALSIAARRVNDSLLRTRTDDAVIDAIIGLETLLSDAEPGEITHKLSMRAAALLRLAPEVKKTGSALLKEFKAIYGYRSKLVHGKHKEAKKICDKQYGGDERGPLNAAIFYLRQLIKVLARHPKYTEPAIIDKELLLQDIPSELSPPQGDGEGRA